ncbi:MAG TPA: hypothetical protein VMS08_02270 [Candidatus Saccharimonadia bacterium]|nr:hypothetical protein [Candidatus Saccharimonadia bacterium]
MHDSRHIGPLQLIVIGFEKPDFEGKIINELRRLRQQKFVRIADSLAVIKGPEGNIAAIEASDFAPAGQAKFGAVISWLIGLTPDRTNVTDEQELGAAMFVGTEYEYGMDPEELATMAQDIPPDGAAIFVLLEHVWVLPLKQAIRDAHGTIIAQDFLSPESLIGIDKEVFAAVTQ